MENRRKNSDRRSFGRTEIFPYTDKNGCVLHKSRSREPDRRLNSLQVEWISMALVHDELVAKCKVDPAGLIIKTEPRAKRVKG